MDRDRDYGDYEHDFDRWEDVGNETRSRFEGRGRRPGRRYGREYGGQDYPGPYGGRGYAPYGSRGYAGPYGGWNYPGPYGDQGYGYGYGYGGEFGGQGRGYGGQGEQFHGEYGVPSYAGLGPAGYQRSDERIAEDVHEALTWDHDVDASNIQVKVDNGEVTLEGTVRDRQQKRAAEDALEDIRGVGDVHNHLRIAAQGSEQAQENTGG